MRQDIGAIRKYNRARYLTHYETRGDMHEESIPKHPETLGEC